jgi:hypothetical protein
MRPQKELEEALTAVMGRLAHLRANWNQALEQYFDPGGFLIAVQNAIATSRTVTFILQSNKAAIPDFDNWYTPFVEKFRNDPIMVWAKDARNKIEKQGDLETLSQVRAELIASYVGNPTTAWLPANVIWNSETFRRSIPKHLLSPHVVENGALAIERRWIDVELPDHEVLDALAHTYGQLALMTISLHEHCRVLTPEKDSDLGEHLLRDLLPDGRLASMECSFEDRGIYIAVKDGSFLGYRREFRTIDMTKAQKAVRRYKAERAWDKLPEAKSLMDVAKIYFQNARTMMLKDGYHTSIFIPLKNNRPGEVIVAQPQNRIDKYLLVRDIAHYVKRTNSNGLLHIAEAWTAAAKDIPKGKFAEHAKERGEILTLAAVNSDGEQIYLSARITRKFLKRWKVKELTPTEVEVGGRLISMAPVLEVWGKLDVLDLHADDENLKWAEQHFKHEASMRP